MAYYKGIQIIKNKPSTHYLGKIWYELKGYSIHSGTFFQSIEDGIDPRIVIDKAVNDKNTPFVAEVWGDNANDIHKRIVFYSQVENQSKVSE